MSAHPEGRKNPVVIARLALIKLAAASLPPTPENYAREYERAAGLPDGAADQPYPEALATENARMLSGIVEMVGQTTTGLAVGIKRFDGDLKTMFNEVDQLGPESIRGLIEGLIASGLAMQQTIDVSRLELDNTRQRLDQVTGELERSRAQARIDPLTGSVNRRGMEEMLGREIARAHRARTPLSLAILDIDHFKRVNDEHGHDVGDQALVHLATLIKSGLRDTDIVCRYGGEEFAVILPGSGIQGAWFVVDRMRVMAEKTPLRIASGPLQIRFSAGVAELSADEDRATLFKRADEALYAAKDAGRNRALVAKAVAA